MAYSAQHTQNGTAAISPAAPSSLAARMGYSAEKLEFIRRAIANNAPDLELEYFLSFCKAKGLDPSAKEVYYIPRNVRVDGKYEKRWTIQISIEGYRSIAERTGEYDGQDDAEYEVDDKGKLVSAIVRVYRKGISRPFSGRAYWDEYVQKNNDGTIVSMWARMPRNQLAKCAEALAFRKGFPGALGGTYTPDEMAQADNPEEHAPHAVTDTRAHSVKAKLQKAQGEPMPTAQRVAEPVTIEQNDPGDGAQLGLIECAKPSQLENLFAYAKRKGMKAEQFSAILAEFGEPEAIPVTDLAKIQQAIDDALEAAS